MGRFVSANVWRKLFNHRETARCTTERSLRPQSDERTVIQLLADLLSILRAAGFKLHGQRLNVDGHRKPQPFSLMSVSSRRALSWPLRGKRRRFRRSATCVISYRPARSQLEAEAVQGQIDEVARTTWRVRRPGVEERDRPACAPSAEVGELVLSVIRHQGKE